MKNEWVPGMPLLPPFYLSFYLSTHVMTRFSVLPSTLFSNIYNICLRSGKEGEQAGDGGKLKSFLPPPPPPPSPFSFEEKNIPASTAPSPLKTRRVVATVLSKHCIGTNSYMTICFGARIYIAKGFIDLCLISWSSSFDSVAAV